MIGVFDSGVGGLNSYRELRRSMPFEEIIFLADRKNAPYGTKCENEILRLVKSDIRLLRDMGADKILIACCTASTVYDKLCDEDRQISIPIIQPSARAAALVGEKIAVIATERTVASHSFKNEILRASPRKLVSEIPAQILVSTAERFVRIGYLDTEAEKALDTVAEKITQTGADALVLGCTHFAYFEDALLARIPNIKMINPAKIGAGELIKSCEKLPHPRVSGHTCGRTVFIDTE